MKINIKAIALSIFAICLSTLQECASDENLESRVKTSLSELVNFCAKAKEKCELELFVYTIEEGEKILEEKVTKVGSLKAVLDNKIKELSAEELATARVLGRCPIVDRSKFCVYK